MWSIYTMEYYASIRKDKYPTFVATWTGLEEIMLSEISQTERVKYHMVSLIALSIISSSPVLVTTKVGYSSFLMEA